MASVRQDDDYPRSMRDPGVRQRRRAMLTLSHIAPLTRYAADLRGRGQGEVPEFDPFDGGLDARALFLFEKPGPMTAEGGRGRRLGSGFISRNNDDPTAEATFNFMQQAELPRTQTVLWNVVPWWNGTTTVRGTEMRVGLECVEELVSLVPKLRAAILVGRKAQEARGCLESRGLAVLVSDHPSPLVRARFPERWKAIPTIWGSAREFMD